jgi:hypothetical protein
VLPDGYQVKVTLTRYLKGAVYDHRYCDINAGDDHCSTPGIRTESCDWTYRTTAIVNGLNGTSWVTVARSVDEDIATSCKK